LATPEQFATLAASTSLTTAQAVLGQLYAYAGTPASVQKAGSDYKITVGLMLERANDPMPLLASDWATRQSALADQQAIWNAYGADPATYASAASSLTALLGADALAERVQLGYVSSAADRTIWLTLDARQFAALFGTDLLVVDYQAVTQPSAWRLGDSTRRCGKRDLVRKNGDGRARIVRHGYLSEREMLTVRHRIIRAKCCLSKATALAMVFKFVEDAQKCWRRLKGHNQLPKVVLGAKFTYRLAFVTADPQP